MIYRTIPALQEKIENWKQEKQSVGLVPTMGALHEGHLSLIDQAQKLCDRVIVSIFVNPTQFDNLDDLNTYPRTEDRDVALLSSVDAIFIPSVQEMYPGGFSSAVHVSAIAEKLEGLHRPGHFDGMATVVLKLLNISRSDIAFFGEKDWQQLQIVRQMVDDFNLPVLISGCATLRDNEGLALSSRNRRLSDEDRKIAATLPSILRQVANIFVRTNDRKQAEMAGVKYLEKAGFTKVDYLAICDAKTLCEVDKYHSNIRILSAAWIGKVRLIDNISIDSD